MFYRLLKYLTSKGYVYDHTNMPPCLYCDHKGEISIAFWPFEGIDKPSIEQLMEYDERDIETFQAECTAEVEEKSLPDYHKTLRRRVEELEATVATLVSEIAALKAT